MEKRLVIFLSNISALIAFVLGMISIFGWLAQIDSLIRIVSFLPPMRFAVAIILMLAGTGIASLKRKKNLWAYAASILIISYAVVGSVNTLFHLNLNLDFSRSRVSVISPATMSGIFLIGWGLFFAAKRNSEKAMRIVLALSVSVLFLALISLLRYLFHYGDPSDTNSGMAVHTAVALVCLAISLFFKSCIVETEKDDEICEWHPAIVVLKTFSIRRKFLLLSLTLICGLTVFGAATFQRFIDSNDAWQRYNDTMVPRQKLRYKMRELFGYGGGTFYFKNYILRGTPEYEHLARETFDQLLKTIDEFIALSGKTQREAYALEAIRESATDYLFNLDVVSAFIKKKMQPRDIDLKIWIDDDKAMIAFDNLNIEYQALAQSVFDEINRARELLIFVATMGFVFALIVIIVFGYLINHTILAVIGKAKHAADDISNEKYDTEIHAETKDELGLLMQSLALMRDRIRDSRSTILSRTEDLARTNAFLNSIFDNLPSMVYLKDAKNLKYTHFNRAGEKLIGLNRDVVLGQNDFDILPRIRAEEIRRSDQSALSSGGLVEIPEETMELRTGVRVLSTKKIPIMDLSGIPSHVLGISEDVTDRRQLERSLREYKERLNLALKDAHIAAWDWTIRGDSMTGDETFYQLLGYDKIPARLGLAAFCENIHADDRGPFSIAVLDCIRSQRDLDLKFRYVRPVDRRTRYFTLKAKIYLDYSGKADLVSGIISDVSERHENENMYRLSDERFQRIFGHAPIGILLIDLKGTINDANEAFLRMTGYSRTEIVALKWNLHLTPTEWESADNTKYKDVVERGWTDIYEKEFVRKDKNRLPVQVAMTRLDAQGANVILFVRGLSKEREIEKQVRTSRESLDLSNQEFEYIMHYLSEEVKEPLKNMFMRSLSQEGLAIDSLLETLMSYFYVKSERPKFAEISTKQLVDELVLDLKPLTANTSIQINVQDLPSVIAARSPIQVLFHTLLTLAVRRSKAAGVIEVTGRTHGENYEFIIKDSGPKISDKFQVTNFNMNDIQLISNHQLGLALLICKKVIEIHHGKLWYEVQKNPSGNIFGFSVPKFN